VIPKLNFVNRLLISKLFMFIKTELCGPFPHCLSVPFQPMYSQYSQQGSVCVFCVSHRNSTTSLRVEILLNVNPQPRYFTNHDNSLGVPSRSSFNIFSVSMSLCRVCMIFPLLVCLTVYQCFPRCSFCVFFHVHKHPFQDLGS